MAGEYLQTNANERHHRSAGNFVPTPLARFPQPESGGETSGRLAQKEHQATLFLVLRFLKLWRGVPLPPKENANLRFEDHNVPPTLVCCEHGASREQLPQDY